MKIEDIAKPEPVFDFETYFSGHTKASGCFCDRFGNIRKHFTGDFVGCKEGDHFVLDETLAYSDGITEKRVWNVTINAGGRFRAEGDSLHGPASGRLFGNTLNLKYLMSVSVANNKTWKLSMDDWMVYQPDGSLHNITRVLKFGFLVGTVSTQYSKINRAGRTASIESLTSANDENAGSLNDGKINISAKNIR